ncbi:uncharacterized protein ARMOST_18810 [Armillaria ostoyae]|uniref:Uncharacterized protein n=1 Tax=Armillaria ostoyae TaxID=47428 RepID=A0A284S2W8_ARMOS|nr:uncharacterized protein ARMOST_18810 [Armillaria ostoyae]
MGNSCNSRSQRAVDSQDARWLLHITHILRNVCHFGREDTHSTLIFIGGTTMVIVRVLSLQRLYSTESDEDFYVIRRDAWASCINVERNVQLLALRSIAEYHSSQYWMLTSPTLFSMLRVPQSQQGACKSRDSWAFQAVILVQIISSLINATRRRQLRMFTQFWREPLAWLKHQIYRCAPVRSLHTQTHRYVLLQRNVMTPLNRVASKSVDLSDLYGIRQSGRSVSYSEALHCRPLIRLGKNHSPNPSPVAQDDGSTFNVDKNVLLIFTRLILLIFAFVSRVASFTKERLANQLCVRYQQD